MSFVHAPHEEGNQSIHSEKWIIERLSAVLLDALYSLGYRVAMQVQTSCGLEGITVLLKQCVQRINQAMRIFAPGFNEWAKGLVHESFYHRAVPNRLQEAQYSQFIEVTQACGRPQVFRYIQCLTCLIECLTVAGTVLDFASKAHKQCQFTDQALQLCI